MNLNNMFIIVNVIVKEYIRKGELIRERSNRRIMIDFISDYGYEDEESGITNIVLRNGIVYKTTTEPSEIDKKLKKARYLVFSN